jgi:hypothetical protein
MQICEKLLCSKYFRSVSVARWELRMLFCCAVLFLVAAVAQSFAADADANDAAEPFVGVRVIHCKSAAPRTVDMWVTEIDGRAPGVSFLVTPSNGELPGDTMPETTREFVTRVGAQLGINGSFFSVAAKAMDGKAQYNVTGLSVSKGDAYSPFARGFVNAINISRDNVPTIIRAAGARALRSANVVTKKKSVPEPPHVPGTIPLKTTEVNIGFDHEPPVKLYNALSGKSVLVAEGKNVAGDERSIHPRTSIGINADGKVLLFTVDGREAGRSEGLKVSEMADILIRFGAREAINLDGGGSTTFVMDDSATPENDPKVMNLPCDPFKKENEGKEHGKERATGNNLAVFARVKRAAGK